VSIETQPVKSMADWHKTIFDVTHRGGFRLSNGTPPQNPSDWRGASFFHPNTIKTGIS
jgi:hypothetical protein